MKKIVLAYSGGLDTSVAIRWLSQKGFQVIAFLADVGQGEDFGPIRRRALACGASQVVIKDLRESFAREYILPALRAGAVYERKYLLATALSRPLIAKALGEAAVAHGARTVAHGCTGKGNDQVRLEVTLKILFPRLAVLAPLREWELKSRAEEIRYAARHKLPIAPPSQSRFSIDQNLWGVSIESGPLEDPWVEPPPEAYQWTKEPSRAPARPLLVTVDWLRGVPAGINGKRLSLTRLIERLNHLGSAHGIGRSDLIEDRLVGIKSREVYEAPAAHILHAAHQELEQLTLDREMLIFKEIVAGRYARLVYDGLWFTPLKAALDRWVDESQRRVSGRVRLKLYRGTLAAVGRGSPNALYRKALATYQGKDEFDQRWAGGFIALWGLPYAKP
ncbi:MAG: argininosuccinate synthase [Candidatus Omnitrophica bacterium]|nr:argininosuccinate synthase [Candidatus Omnitrophota bacterium]